MKEDADIAVGNIEVGEIMEKEEEYDIEDGMWPWR